MNDRLFYPLVGLVAVALIALAMVWPQGQGARSPGPFGSVPVQQRPEYKAALDREKARAVIEAGRAKGEAAAPAPAPPGEPTNPIDAAGAEAVPGTLR